VGLVMTLWAKGRLYTNGYYSQSAGAASEFNNGLSNTSVAAPRTPKIAGDPLRFDWFQDFVLPSIHRPRRR
jgi:hypothetical protein